MAALLNQRAFDFDSPKQANSPRFDGPDLAAADHERLAGQMLRVFDYMKSGEWRTLREIADATGDPESSISAQLRHLRKPRFGSHTVERKHDGGGLHFYRLIVRAAQ
jgi:hypothetical protein